jgi:hypothetical protein
MNNLLSYCGITDARMRASEKDLPVTIKHVDFKKISNWGIQMMKTLKKLTVKHVDFKIFRQLRNTNDEDFDISHVHGLLYGIKFNVSFNYKNYQWLAS